VWVFLKKKSLKGGKKGGGGGGGGGARFSARVQTGPGAHPASCTMVTGSLLGIMRPWRGVDNPPHLETNLKKE